MKKHLVLALGLALSSGAVLAQSTPATPVTPTPATPAIGNPSDRPVGAMDSTMPSDSTMPAQTPDQAVFGEMDRNSDGRLSRDELRDNKDLTQRFQSMDTNRDGNLSEQEYSASASGTVSKDGARGSAETKRKN